MNISAARWAIPRRVTYGWDLVRELVVRDMKLRYKRSFLGLAWTLINPLSQLLVFSFVFQKLFKVDMENFPAFLFIGIVAWNWFSGALLQATSAILENRDLVRQPGFPAAMLPNVTVASHLIHYVLTLPILFGLLAVSGIPIRSTAWWLPVIVVLQYELTLALSFFVAYLHVTFRDTQYLLGIFLMLGFFMTPILYPVSLVPAEYQAIYSVNPMAHLINAYRAVLSGGEMPELGSLAIVAGASTVLLGVGYWLFRRASISFAEEI